ncbi:MAG: hypothetical protein ACRBI6_03225 [Acidimicrobiales bacterium]
MVANRPTGRYSIPHATDGPKLTLGVLWFAAMAFGIARSWPVAAVVAGGVAATAGLQAGDAWRRHTAVDRRVSAALAGTVALAGGARQLGLGIAVVIAVLACAVWVVVGLDLRRVPAALRPLTPTERLIVATETAVLTAVPVGLAAGALVALGRSEPWAALALLGLVSAYEAGDFLVGSGSANAVEGPIAGLVSLAVVGFGLWLVQPDPFDGTTAVLFSAVAAVSCPLGQLAGSALLPHGADWAPAVRRLDSYLVAAPLWLLLVTGVEPVVG